MMAGGSLFSRGDDPNLRARRLLALGLNAAAALNPRLVRVHSGEVALSLRPGEPDRIEAAPATSETRIHVRQRFRPGLAVEFLLAQQCTHHCRDALEVFDFIFPEISVHLFQGEHVWPEGCRCPCVLPSFEHAVRKAGIPVADHELLGLQGLPGD